MENPPSTSHLRSRKPNQDKSDISPPSKSTPHQSNPSTDDPAPPPDDESIDKKREETWLDPGTKPPSTRFLPAYILLVAIFIALYLLRQDPAGNNAEGEVPLDLSSQEICREGFNYSYPVNAAMAVLRERSVRNGEDLGLAGMVALELFDPEMGTFGAEAFPGGKIPGLGWRGRLKPGLLYVDRGVGFVEGRVWIAGREVGVGEALGVGVPAVMLTAKRVGAKGVVDWLAAEVRGGRRFGNGAVAAVGEGEMEVRAETVGVVHPFLAYYAVLVGDVGIMREAVEQIGLYRELLVEKRGKSKGLWRHIVGSAGVADEDFWATGNALAAWGMVRVRATIAAWERSNDVLTQEKDNLDSWILEILDAAIKADDDDTQLLRNYLYDETSFGECLGTSLLAAVAYRMATIKPEIFAKDVYLAWAGRKRLSVMSRVNEDGIVKPAIDPVSGPSREAEDVSPQAQAFLNSLGTAWRDCVCAGICLEAYYQEHPQRIQVNQSLPWDNLVACLQGTVEYSRAYIDGRLRYFRGPNH